LFLDLIEVVKKRHDDFGRQVCPEKLGFSLAPGQTGTFRHLLAVLPGPITSADATHECAAFVAAWVFKIISYRNSGI